MNRFSTQYQPTNPFVAQSDVYRYGFNGKESVGEMASDGNHYDYGMRVYDPRVGRPLCVDPISGQFPELSPYQFFSNNPVWFIDLDGLEGTPALPVKPGSLLLTTPVDQTLVKIPTHKLIWHHQPKKPVEIRVDEIGVPTRDILGAAEGKEFAQTIGLDMVISIYLGKDLETGEDLEGWDYAFAAASGLLEVSRLGKIIPENAERAVIGGLRKTKEIGKILTNKQARESAGAFGWMEVSSNNIPDKVKDQLYSGKSAPPVFWDKKSKTYLSPDQDGHRGDYAWKQVDTDGNRSTIIFNGETFNKIGE